MSDDFDTDFDNDFDGETDNWDDGQSGSSVSATDRVADLLMGGNGEGANDNTGTNNPTSSGKDFITRRDDEPTSAPQAPAHASNTPFPEDNALQQYGSAHKIASIAQREINNIVDLQQRGEIDLDQAERMVAQHVNQLASAKLDMQAAEMNDMRRQQWLENAHQQLNNDMGDDWRDPVKRKGIQTKAVDMMRQAGVTDREIAAIDDPRGMKIVYKAIQHAEENKQLKAQVAMLKKERGMANRRAKQGRRDSNVGGRSHSGGSGEQLDQVMEILAKNGGI